MLIIAYRILHIKSPNILSNKEMKLSTLRIRLQNSLSMRIGLIPFILIMALLFGPCLSIAEDYCDQLLKEALAVEKCYDAQQYAKARKLMDALKAKPTYKDMMSRLACPNAVTGLIRKLDRMIEDKEGDLDTLPRFSGTVIERQLGPYSGYFEVKDDHGTSNLLSGDMTHFRK